MAAIVENVAGTAPRVKQDARGVRGGAAPTGSARSDDSPTAVTHDTSSHGASCGVVAGASIAPYLLDAAGGMGTPGPREIADNVSGVEDRATSASEPAPPAPTTERRARRCARWVLRHRLRDCQPVPRIRRCGLGRAWWAADAVQVRRGPDGDAWYHGVVSCGSVWACPVCAPKIARGRVEEIETLVARARDHGARPYLVTVTIRHGLGDDPRAIFAAITRTWRRWCQGRWWVQAQRRWGVVAWVRGVEATHGPNGWHPHVHALFLMRAAPDLHDILEWGRRWQRAVEREVGPAHVPSLEHGLDVRECAADRYIAKLGLEIGSTGARKHALPGHRSPWQIAEAAAAGDGEARARWAEWSRATVGRRALTWSAGARRILGRAEYDDAALAERPEAPVAEVVAEISATEWRMLGRAPSWAAAVLDAAEIAGADGVRAVLDAALAAAVATARAGP